MANELRLRWGLQPDQTHATVAIFKGEKILAQIDLPSDSVLQAIHGLGELRQQMIQPDRRSETAASVPPMGVENPLWTLRPRAGTDQLELMVNHPAFGRLAMGFPREEASRLAQQIERLLNGGEKPN